MTGTRDWLTRERGSRDWRLLPAAICGWAASLAAHAGFAYCMSHDGMLGALPAVLTCMIPLAVLAGLPFPRLPASVRRTDNALACERHGLRDRCDGLRGKRVDL